MESYRVTIVVDVKAANEKQAERDALRAIVSDVSGWNKNEIEVTVELQES